MAYVTLDTELPEGLPKNFGVLDIGSVGETETPVPDPSADVRRLVHIDIDGTVTEIMNLEVSGTFMAVRGTFQVKPPARQTISAGPGRRYQGTRAVSETHGNGEVTWKTLVKGTDADDVLANVEQLIAATETLDYPGLHLEWTPGNATYPTYYEVRGPATWTPEYEWAQFNGALSMIVTVVFPVAPLAKGARTSLSVSSFTAPAQVQLPTAVNGTAPALADITVSKASGQNSPTFALLAWWQRQPTAPGGYSNIFGVIEGESGSSLSTWSSGSDANARGGYKLSATASGAGTASASYPVHTGGIDGRTVDVEVWARVYVGSGLVSPRVRVSAAVNGGAGATIYTGEFSSSGRALTVPSSTGFRLTRLGTVTLPLTGMPDTWLLTVYASWAAGSTTSIGLDYLVCVPARQRACSPSAVTNDSTYPWFMPSGTSAYQKQIRSDLSGALTSSGVTAPDAGLGGTLIEFPPGDVDMLLLPGSHVPDEPASANTQQKEWTSTSMTVDVTPRYYLVRSA